MSRLTRIQNMITMGSLDDNGKWMFERIRELQRALEDALGFWVGDNTHMDINGKSTADLAHEYALRVLNRLKE